MKVFISSLIAGFEEFRRAAVSAVTSLGHEPITAETFGAGTDSPRLACLGGVREADLVILILGGDYGAVQPVSGISATHEEYREAKDRRPVLAFVQEGMERDARQTAFVQEVQDWQSGLFRQGFRTPDALRDAITRDIHRYELANAAAPVDAIEMLARATALIPREQRNMIQAGGPFSTWPSLGDRLSQSCGQSRSNAQNSAASCFRPPPSGNMPFSITHADPPQPFAMASCCSGRTAARASFWTSAVRFD